jgi:low affinity Fe/Cu permease
MATTPKAKGRQVTANLKEAGARTAQTPSRVFSDLAQITSREVGRAWVFALAMGTVLVWAITGPLFHFSDTWQLVINTGTTIVTFLMVFLIQNSQNRDSAAIQVKLDELIRVSRANNSLVGVEHLTDDELEEIRTRCESRAQAELARRAAAREAAGNTTRPLSLSRRTYTRSA